MKRLITAFGFTLVTLSASAVEVAAPFEQLDLDRALPTVDFPGVKPYAADSSAPFEQLTLDRALPNVPSRKVPSRNVHFAESASGGTRTDAGDGTEAETESPWANDHNFIAPAL
jgi:hypothetical protein